MTDMAAEIASPANPRKRKKRSTTGGAAADCFKCAERAVKCDRKRPYCSQCLEIGQDCSGYKTQLTWGVGVASRGKLKGLSLPVAGTKRLPPPESQSRAKRRKESTDTKSESITSTSPISPAFHQPPQSYLPPPIPPPQAWHAYPPPPMVPHVPLYNPPTPASPQQQYSYPSFSNGYNGYQNGPGNYPTMHSPTNLYAAPASPFSTINRTLPVPVPSRSVSPGSHYIYPSIPDIRDPPPPVPMFPPPEQTDFNNDRQNFDGISMLLQAGQVGAIPQPQEVVQDQKMEAEADEEIQRNFDECAVLDTDLTIMSIPDLEIPNLDMTSSLMPPLTHMSVGKTPRMQYLINYYAEVISPVIVAFDSPNNPFRTQVLRLALNSETLQHALSALAASNLRQRKGANMSLSTGKTAPARRSSFAHVQLTGEQFHQQKLLSPEEQIREETFHKRLAVSQLNQQLAHPVLRKDDSILATLLILCLFHICDSGIAKFQTQFAGVRKLLALRGDELGNNGEESRWMSRLFTWYDSLAATVNDREGQLSGHFLDMSSLSGDWALENLAGIDGNLFQTISQLGRLNMLRQGKPVESASTGLPMPALNTNATKVHLNGWSEDTNMNNDHELDGVEQEQFWNEYRSVQNSLLEWTLDTSLFDRTSNESSYLTADQRLDLGHISNAFRYSALLYLERLAQPHLLMSSNEIQRWVRISLQHIEKVQADVYLLWPLFITGSECVDEASRSVIRGRCTDIQRDSGFSNNASCLELLEKVWRAQSPLLSSIPEESDDLSEAPETKITRNGNKVRGNPFKFRDVMYREGLEGEYIVV